MSFGSYGVFAFPIVLVGGLLFGLPIILLCKKLNWLNWWQALLGGILAPVPYILFYLSANPGHTEHVGLYNSVFALGMGMLGALVVWVVGIFRNPVFQPSNTRFPLSFLLAVPLLTGVYYYHDALAPEYLLGCITSYEPAENPTPWNTAYITVVTEDGNTFRDGITVGYSNPDIVGNCAWGSKKRTVFLQTFMYSSHSVDSKGCQPPCPNQSSSTTPNAPPVER
ncbi:MAG: hypothetical protein AAF541_12215 [Pseudomonadota bacterium]